jgi:hypothetical protein
MDYKTKRILITVKAYPNPSKKYVETVCVAGIDIEKYEWARLYPIRFRDLEEDKKFKKYNIIKIKVFKPSDDNRAESFKVDPDSIKIIDYLKTEDKWSKRKSIVLPTVSNSMCEIIRQNKKSKKSLGVFKPVSVDFYWKRSRKINTEEIKSYYSQLSLLYRKKIAIEHIPYDFYYRFHCYNESNCPGHNFSIIDWEIKQAFRDWKYRYKGEELLLNKIKERWLSMTSDKKDTYFYVGNMKRFPKNFMVLGVFYPPKV